MSERVALRLPLPEAVITWFVTGFLDPCRDVGVRHDLPRRQRAWCCRQSERACPIVRQVSHSHAKRRSGSLWSHL